MDINIHVVCSYICLPDITEQVPGTALGWGNGGEREPSTLVLKEFPG